MDDIMQEYYQKWKYKHPTPEDFRSVFEKNTNKDLTWYFNSALLKYQVRSLFVFFSKTERKSSGVGCLYFHFW